MSAAALAHIGVDENALVVIVLDSGGSSATPRQYSGTIISIRIDDNGKPYAVQLIIDEQRVWFNYDRILRWWCPPTSKR